MSEAKQLPRLAIAGPVMGARGNKNYRIGNVVPAVLPMCSLKTLQRPGDVYRPMSRSSSRHTPRPLGLIPERQDFTTNDLLDRYSRTLLSQHSKLKQGESDDKGNKLGNQYNVTKPSTPLPTTRLKPLNGGQYRAKSALKLGENIQSSTTTVPSTLCEETDPDYMDMLETLNIPPELSHPCNSPEPTPLDKYARENSYQKQRHSVSLPIKINKLNKPSTRSHRRAHSLKPYSEVADSTIDRRYLHHSGHTSTKYFNFVEQASLNHRNFDTDKRDGLDYIPCERCRLRGGRCSNCKTIRVGGGYIVLDGDGENMKRGHGDLHDDSQVSINHLPALTNASNQGMENSPGRKRSSKSNLLQQDQGNDGRGNGSANNLEGNNNWGYGANRNSYTDRNGSKTTMLYNLSNANLGANKSSSSGLDSSGSNLGHRPGVGLSHGDGTGSDMDATNQAKGRPGSSQPASSRPMSSRPKSSRNRTGNDIGSRRSYEGKNRKGGASMSVDKNHGGRHKKKSGDDDSDDDNSDDDDDDRRRRRRKKKDDSNLPDIDENDKTKKKKDFNLHGKYGGEDDDSDQRLRYTGSLHKFKSKEDNTKALKCTLRELQGIDPLDYLAKYCIIDPSKVPNYRRVYDNVDRDEDDEIDINELDFALKAVNYDLISGAEIDYVNQILELSSRYKLNFHLFSVIAALSEKVVALEDMVKKLINTMDLKALETKMKKCKELFYLLDDMDSGERGGVVTIASLAVELQAGGLTEEHVEFVVDRLNHDKRGLVEFLDYLTYVPLFVEIHDSVCGNPLDFTRTK